MLILIWEYRVIPERSAEFENIYSSEGAWVELFSKSAGFQGTELLRDAAQPYRYITIDRWTSAQEYDSFLSRWKAEYTALDAQCQGLTERESLLGQWELLYPETR
jgi:heme-degrading monooxygenase HmoA